MSRGAVGNASQIVPRGGRSGTGAPSGAVSGLRRRPVRSGGAGGKQAASMNYYTDDSPGLKISPVVVISMSIGFIVFVTILHVVGKLRGA
mmetsp:Transcript_25579/g.55724  ORF Transcript_25579/g.55724 Transcript_25579/m.55724 type:complete len:90 (-) Transcript_25579:1719-1988(-)